MTPHDIAIKHAATAPKEAEIKRLLRTIRLKVITACRTGAHDDLNALNATFGVLIAALGRVEL